MKPRIANPIRRDDLDPELRTALDRYLDKLKKATGEQWQVEHFYKPTRWYRARLTSPGGDWLIVWYRPKRRYWTVIKTYTGRGFLRRRRIRSSGDPETAQLIIDAMKRLKSKETN